jgi:hypothetical protein
VAEGAGDGSRKEIEARVLETKVNTLSCAIAVAPLSPAAAATTQIEALEECPRGYRAWAAPLLKLEAGRRRMGREEEERESGRGEKGRGGPAAVGMQRGGETQECRRRRVESHFAEPVPAAAGAATTTFPCSF